jgi:hypothetical protein
MKFTISTIIVSIDSFEIVRLRLSDCRLDWGLISSWSLPIVGRRPPQFFKSYQKHWTFQ